MTGCLINNLKLNNPLLNNQQGDASNLITKKLYSKYKKLVLLQKAMLAFKSGLAVRIDGKIFFAAQTTEPQTLSLMQNPDFVYTYAYYKYHFKTGLSLEKTEPQNTDGVATKDYKSYAIAAKPANAAIKLAMHAALQPVVIECDDSEILQDLFEPLSVSCQEIDDFETDKYYNLTYLCHAGVANEYSDDTFLYAFQSSFSGETHYAIVVGSPDFTKPVKVRVHSSCYTGDLMHSLRCDCKYQLHNAIKFLADQDGGGIVIYLMQEGRGIGLANKLFAYKYQQEDGLNTVDSNLATGFDAEHRNFLPAKLILDYFKIASVELITNNPIKQKQLTELGIEVSKIIHFSSPANKHNKDYLKVKVAKMGHEGL